jgi:predicted unusual protein kinase regulating ubiquinone biosynthesis (AarF/ABC1/UbiB family)
MSHSPINPRRRGFAILRLFFALVVSFSLQYVRARLSGRSYDFFEDSDHNRRRAIAIREAALRMGGVLVKVGQFLSSRVDLLPSEYIEELALLQDEVPGVAFEAIRAQVEAAFGRPLADVFPSFDPVPVAAASLGQVHRATLPTGETVAVKVQRPHIREIVEADLAAIRYIVRWLNRHTPIGRRANLPLILREFEDTLRLELDYQREGHHAERIAVIFAGNPAVAVPRIFWSHSRGTVLTLQFMEGIKVTDFAALDRASISRSETAEALLGAYLTQVLEAGFFHADPHPGNILIRPGPTIVLLDFGMVGDISPAMRDNIRRIFLGVVRRDYDEVVLALTRLGFIPHGANLVVLKRALSWAVENFYGLSFGELQAIDPRLVLDRMQEVFYTESVQIPANFAFLGRALGTLSGLCTALDPSFQFVTVAEPYARRLVGTGAGTLAREAVREARQLASTVYSIPTLSRGLLLRVENGEYDLHREITQVVRAVDRLERAAHRILYGLLVTGFLVAGVLVFPGHYSVFAVGAFLVSLIFLVGAFFPFRRRS